MIRDDCEGRIALVGSEWMVDAEPHITVQFERLFPSSRVQYVYGESEKLEFTHRPRFIGDSTRVRKDIDWFLGRYEIRISLADRKLLQEGAAKFDKARTTARQVYFDKADVELSLALPLRKYQEQAVARVEAIINRHAGTTAALLARQHPRLHGEHQQQQPHGRGPILMTSEEVRQWSRGLSTACCRATARTVERRLSKASCACGRYEQ
jgi:hypothetical protein